MVGCVDPLGEELVAPFDERPPNLGSLDTMADLKAAVVSIRRPQWHECVWGHAKQFYVVKSMSSTAGGDQEKRKCRY